MHFALYSTSKDPSVALALPLIAAAIQVQLRRDLESFNETGGNSTCASYGSEADVEADPQSAADVKFEVTDEIPEAPGAVAYHTTDANGRPLCKIGWAVVQQSGGSLMRGANSLSVGISHECIEAEGDAYVKSWSDYDASREVANEWCDPVQDEAYDIPVPTGDATSEPHQLVAVSNFVTQEWFSDETTGPFDYLGSRSAARQISPGGYVELRTGGPSGETQQVFGEAVPQRVRDQKAMYGRRRQAWGGSAPQAA